VAALYSQRRNPAHYAAQKVEKQRPAITDKKNRASALSNERTVPEMK